MNKDMRVKDSVTRHYEFNGVIIQACDADEDGNVANIDIFVDGQRLFCVNTQSTETLNHTVIQALFYVLANKVNEVMSHIKAENGWAE